jgi:hypothetical protein
MACASGTAALTLLPCTCTCTCTCTRNTTPCRCPSRCPRPRTPALQHFYSDNGEWSPRDCESQGSPADGGWGPRAHTHAQCLAVKEACQPPEDVPAALLGPPPVAAFVQKMHRAGLPVVDVRALTMQRYDLHPTTVADMGPCCGRVSDCTHWCWTPLLYESVWEQLYDAITAHDAAAAVQVQGARGR